MCCGRCIGVCDGAVPLVFGTLYIHIPAYAEKRKERRLHRKYETSNTLTFRVALNSLLTLIPILHLSKTNRMTSETQERLALVQLKLIWTDKTDAQCQSRGSRGSARTFTAPQA